MKPEHFKTVNKRRRNIIILNVISTATLVAAIFWGINVFFHLDASIFTEDAQVESYINPINTRIPGYIKNIQFSEHQRVKKGDTLVILDDREYKIAVQQAAAQMQDAQANRNLVKSGNSIANNSEDIAGSNMDEMKARLLNMETNFMRYSNLLKEDAVTQSQFDQIKTELDAMRAKYRALQGQRRGAVLITDETVEHISSADAAISKAKASLNLAYLNLSYTIIKAPYDGFVGRKIIEEGQLIQAGQPLLSIIKSEDKWVTANYTESQISKLHLGQVVSIKVDAIEGKRYLGTIAAISEATGSRFSAVPVDNSTGNFVKIQQRIPVRIQFSSQNKSRDLALLRAGMNAQITISK